MKLAVIVTTRETDDKPGGDTLHAVGSAFVKWTGQITVTVAVEVGHVPAQIQHGLFQSARTRVFVRQVLDEILSTTVVFEPNRQATVTVVFRVKSKFF